MEKFDQKKFDKKKNLTEKKLKKKFQKFSVNFFFQIQISVFRSQFGVCLQKFGGLGHADLGGDRDCTNST
jgi:hypothetical protein